MKLMNKVTETITKMGDMGKEKLAVKAGVSPSTVRSVANGHVPLPKNAYRLALACGCTDEEALELAKECSSDRAKDTA